MSKFVPFDFNEEVIARFRSDHKIPVHFYNKDGQILIYSKEGASDAEIERLLRFVEQGIYYDVDDAHTLGLAKESREVPDGLSDVKLLTEQTAEELTRNTRELFDQLKQSSVTAVQTRRLSGQLTEVWNNFESQPEAMTGLVNIIDLMGSQESSYQVQLAVKRTVVAMAMKTRGLAAQSYRDRIRIQEMTGILMTSAMLCDIGNTKIKIPDHTPLTAEEMRMIRQHPLMSYMMLAHDPGISEAIKHNVLCHHRPLRDGMKGNNYPETRFLRGRLTMLAEQYRNEPGRQHLADDISRQLSILDIDPPYEEDLNILALASEFASLTSDVPWRPAYSPRRAVEMIINNSFFTYTSRIVREFLDYVSISLCDNQKILSERDFIIVGARTRDERFFFEACQITNATRYQSKPGINRLATLSPVLRTEPKFHIAGFDLTSIKPDRRLAHYELAKDDSRHIVYYVNPEFDADLHGALMELTRRH